MTNIGKAITQSNGPPEEIDARLSFLARAGANHDLVKRNALPLDEAFDGLIEPFSDIVGFPVCNSCGSQPCVNPSFCQACRLADRRVAQKQRWR
jgi:hypothetical protein